MPACNQASTPSRGEIEGINGTGASCCPEANHRNASFVNNSYCRNKKNTPKPSTAQAGQFITLFQAGKQRNINTASPPLIVGDSRYSAAKAKARWPLDPDLTPSTQKA